MKDKLPKLYGGIEGGGTKFICAIGTGRKIYVDGYNSYNQPAETIGKARDFFQHYIQRVPLKP